MILGGEEPPQMPDRAARIPPGPRREAMRADARTAARRSPSRKRRGWGLFGRKSKEEPRMEPAPRRAAPHAPPRRYEPQGGAGRAVARGRAAKPDDLFPDHKRDEQFEIPAFLRRQQN